MVTELNSYTAQVIFALALTITLPFVLRLIPRDSRPWVAYSDSIESPLLSSIFNISIVFLASASSYFVFFRLIGLLGKLHKIERGASKRYCVRRHGNE